VWDTLEIGATGEATFTYQGLTPGLVGVYQLNIELSSYEPTGDLPVKFVRSASSAGALFPCHMNLAFQSRTVLLPIR
jgi:uncharacterized protein (TIGR03437 family)